jgi:DNA mismatch repair protein MSH5
MLTSSLKSKVTSVHEEDAVQTYDTETDADIRIREDTDAMNEVIMAVDIRERSTVGCAYYIAREEKLCLMEDIKMAGWETIDTLKLHAQPTIVLISTRSEEKLEEYLSREARGIHRGDEASVLP